MVRAGEVSLPAQQHKFAPGREWAFDFAWLNERIALEVEGMIYGRGRHVRPTGFLADAVKYNTAVVLGWRIIRVTPDDLKEDGKRVRYWIRQIHSARARLRGELS